MSAAAGLTYSWKRFGYHAHMDVEVGNAVGLPACEIANYEKQFNIIYYDMAEKLAGVLNIDVELLLDDYTGFKAKKEEIQNDT